MNNSLLEQLVKIASKAAQVVGEIYASDFKVNYKGPSDPVTEADRFANELICAELHRHFPGIPVVAEESGPETFAGYQKAGQVFFVDPVDGTREFVAKNDEFAVMIGLLESDLPTHGVIHAPASNTVWAGQVGSGAFRMVSAGARTPIRVSSCETVPKARVVSSRSQSELLAEALAELGAKELIPLGSAGLKAVAVAEGRADLYVTPYHAGKRWDTCAGDALVRAAGGAFSDGYGLPLDYRGDSLENDRGVVAAPGTLHQQVLALLADYRG